MCNFTHLLSQLKPPQLFSTSNISKSNKLFCTFLSLLFLPHSTVLAFILNLTFKSLLSPSFRDLQGRDPIETKNTHSLTSKSKVLPDSKLNIINLKMSQPTSPNQMPSYSVTNVNNNRLHNGCLSRINFVKWPNCKLYQSKNLSQVFAAVCLLLLLLAKSVNSSNENSNVNSIRKNCTKCSLLLEDAKIRRLEEFKRDFLHKLGFKEAPKVTVDKSLYNIPPFDSIFAHRSNYLDGEMMLGDQPHNFEGSQGPQESQNDMDDSTGSIKRVISFAKLRE